jgi:hypothetical protein
MMFQERSATRESEVSEQHHVEYMLRQVEGLQPESKGEAQRRAHIREALRERPDGRMRSIRDLVTVLICRWSRRSSAPCSDARVRPAQ